MFWISELCLGPTQQDTVGRPRARLVPPQWLPGGDAQLGQDERLVHAHSIHWLVGGEIKSDKNYKKINKEFKH
jgi:hypothetical protein